MKISQKPEHHDRKSKGKTTMQIILPQNRRHSPARLLCLRQQPLSRCFSPKIAGKWRARGACREKNFWRKIRARNTTQPDSKSSPFPRLFDLLNRHSSHVNRHISSYDSRHWLDVHDGTLCSVCISTTAPIFRFKEGSKPQ